MWPLFSKKKFKLIIRDLSLLEHNNIVVSNILDHIDHFNILVDNQHDFRAWCSCETQLVGFFSVFFHDFATSIQRGQVDAATMVFGKAFYIVHHGGLLLELVCYGILDITHNGIKALRPQISKSRGKWVNIQHGACYI